MIKNIVWAVIFIIVAAILQSTLIIRLAYFFRIKVMPDITLCILVFSAYQNGMMTGQVTGFFSGLFLDFLSQSPLGLNIFVRTIVGALTGMIRGSLILDAVFLPMGLCAAATLLKATILFLLHILFAGNVQAYQWTAPTLWIELGLNMLIAPFLFDFLKKFGSLLVKQREI